MIQYSCPQCGGQFTTEQPVNTVRCPYCGNEFQVAIGRPSTAPQQPQQPQSRYASYGQPRADIGVFDIGPSGKSRGVAGLLAILLGWLGVHYFYCGKTAAGFLCILLSLVTCSAWNVITIIQGVLMMTMTSEEFERKYVNSDSTMPLF